MNRVVFLDVEASSLKSGYPIEVGFAEIMPDGSIRSAARLICCDEWLNDVARWDPRSEQVHGISRDYLRKEGQPPDQVAEWLNAELAGALCFSDSPLDSQWLDELTETAGEDGIYRVEQAFSIADVWAAFERPEIDRKLADQLVWAAGHPKAHRAAADAEHWARLWLASRQSQPTPNSGEPS